jgi:hypothetical protein
MSIAGLCPTCGLPLFIQKALIKQTGSCSYCEFHRNNGRQIYNYARNKQLFMDRLESVRGKYAYDAMVGISGGKDGVFVLHKLVRDYRLKVLALTYDNEFMAKDVRRHIEQIVKTYQVDHAFYRSPNLTGFYRGVMATLGIPCFACATAGYYMSFKVALERNIPFIVHGRSPYQMFRNLDANTYDNDIFFAFIRTNLVPYDAEFIKSGYVKAYHSIKTMVGSLPLDQVEKDSIMKEYFDPLLDMRNDFVPESLAYFLTEPYDEKAIRTTLQQEAGYTAPGSHSDCTIHNVANYLTAVPDGISVDVLEAAVMRRNGLMGKDEYETLLQQRKREVEHPTEQIGAELSILCNHLGIKPEQIRTLRGRTVAG